MATLSEPIPLPTGSTTDPLAEFDRKAGLFLKAVQEKGLDVSKARQLIQQKRAQLLVPEAVKSGTITKQQAIEAYGGLGAPGTERILGLQEPTEEAKPTAEQTFRLESAKKAVDRLESLFGRGEAENVGTGKDLSLAGSATLTGKAAAGAQALGRKVFDSKFQEDLNIFTSALENAKGIFTQAFGSGTPQAFEAEELLRNAPGPTSTDREAEEWFNTVRSFLGENLTDENKTETGQTDITREATDKVLSQPSITEEQPRENNLIQRIAGKAAEAAPVLGGIAGGIGGGAVGAAGGTLAAPGIGTISGGITLGAIGTAAGTAAGRAVQESIQDLAGLQDESAREQVSGMLKQAAVAGITDAALGGTFKLVGKAGKPILKSIARGIDDIPLKNLRINPSQLTKFNAKHGEDLGEFLVKRKLLGENSLEMAAGKAGELQNTFDQLALNEGITIPVESLEKRFAKEIGDLAGVEAGSKTKLTPSFNRNIAESVLNEWRNVKNQIQQMGIENLNPKQLTQFRRQIDDVIPDSQFTDPSVKNIAVRLRKIFNDVVQEGVDARLLGEGETESLKILGQELSKYYDFLEIAERQQNLGRGSRLLSLPKLLSGGLGIGIGSTFGPAGAGVGGIVGTTALEALSRDPSVLQALFKGGVAARQITPQLGRVARAGMGILAPIAGATAGKLVE